MSIEEITSTINFFKKKKQDKKFLANDSSNRLGTEQ